MATLKISDLSVGDWVVNAEGLERRSEELIDALYNMCIKLKEEEVT